MFASFTLAAMLAGGPIDLTTIQREIRREPVYEGRPRYCLLVFGPTAATRIWLIQDDKHSYVDFNGNADLTEPGEKLAGNSSIRIEQIAERDGPVRRGLNLYNLGNGQFRLMMGQRGQRRQFVGFGLMEKPTWGDRPENAPIIHLNGPLALERYGPILTMPRSDSFNHRRRHSLRLMVGTPGVGKGTFASYDDTCSQNLGDIQADIAYPHATQAGRTFRERIELVHDG